MTARFSVVVPLRSVAEFADGCLASIRRQTGVEIEVVAVDDDCPDGCGAIADRHAARDRRFTALHRTRSEGVGAARNAGIDRATGEYLLFLDGDDAFHAEDVLSGLDDDLRRAGDPDVLVFDYEQARPCGLGRRGNLRWVLDVDGPRLLRPDERATALGLSWVCWNKAYRRESVAGLRFPPGYYEDFAWTLRVMLGAERVGVSGRVGVDYRCCRTAGISRGTSPRHLEVFDQFDRVLEFLRDRPELDSAEVRSVLGASVTTFLRSRSERRKVVPAELLPAFRRRSDELVARIARSTGTRST